MAEDITLNEVLQNLSNGWNLSKSSITSSLANHQGIGVELMRTNVEMCKTVYDLSESDPEFSEFTLQENWNLLFHYWAEGNFLLGEHNAKLVLESMKDLQLGILSYKEQQGQYGDGVMPNMMTFDPATTSKYLQYVDASVIHYSEVMEIHRISTDKGLHLDDSFRDSSKQHIDDLLSYAQNVAVANEEKWFLDKYFPPTQG